MRYPIETYQSLRLGPALIVDEQLSRQTPTTHFVVSYLVERLGV